MDDREDEVRFLLIGYDADQAGEVAAALEAASDRYVVTTTDDPHAVFGDTGADCIVLEIPLAGISPEEFIAAITEEPPPVPVVPLTYADGAGETAGVHRPTTVSPDSIDDLVDRVEAALSDEVSPIGGRELGRYVSTEYEVISEAAPIGLFTLDENGVIQWANQVYMDTLGLSAEELVGKPFVELIEEGYYDEETRGQYQETVRELLSSDTDLEQRSYPVTTYAPDGMLVHDVHITLLPMDDGEFRGTVIAFRDVTTQKAYEQELERQNERLNAFTSVVSHDLRNPLGIARGYLSLALDADEPDREDLEAVQDALDRMEALIENLLTLAREGRAVQDPTVVDLGDVAHRAWASVDTGDASLHVDDPGVVLADPDRVQQLFENLFRNSVEHGSTSSRPPADDSVEHGSTGNRAKPDDSVEHGSTGSRPPADDSVEHATVEGQSLAVTVGPLDDGTGFFVADDGPGIPAEQRDRVFEHGYTTTEGGTGFGLEIVRTIVEAHDWSIRVTEGDAGGARFEVAGVTRPT